MLSAYLPRNSHENLTMNISAANMTVNSSHYHHKCYDYQWNGKYLYEKKVKDGVKIVVVWYDSWESGDRMFSDICLDFTKRWYLYWIILKIFLQFELIASISVWTLSSFECYFHCEIYVFGPMWHISPIRALNLIALNK